MNLPMELIAQLAAMGLGQQPPQGVDVERRPASEVGVAKMAVEEADLSAQLVQGPLP